MPIFPSDWPTATTEVAQLSAAHKASAAKAPRLTPAQRRMHMYASLIEAIKDGDALAVQKVIADHPNISLDEPGCEHVASAAFEHYTPEVFECLRTTNLPCDPNLYMVLCEKFNPTLYKQFLLSQDVQELSLVEKMFVEKMFNQTLKNMLHETPKVRDSSRRLRSALLNDFPDLSNLINSNRYSTTSWQVNLLNQLPVAYPENFHSDDFDFVEQLPTNVKEMCVRGIAARADDVTIAQLHSINRFFDSHPSYAQLFENAQKKQTAEHTTYMNLMRSLIPVGSHTWKDTAMASYLQQLHDTWPNDTVRMFTVHHHFTNRDGDVHNNLVRCNTFATTFDLDQQLGFDVYDRLFRFATFTKIHVAEDNTLSSLKHSCYPEQEDFFTTMIISGSPAATVLLQNPQMAERVSTLLQNKHHLMTWATKAPLAAVQQLCKAQPHWKTWTDEAGNTLAHYILALRSKLNINEKTVQNIIRINPSWLTQANNNQVTLTHIAQEQKWDANLQNWIQNQALNVQLKSDATTRKKISSRPKSSRKM